MGKMLIKRDQFFINNNNNNNNNTKSDSTIHLIKHCNKKIIEYKMLNYASITFNIIMAG